MPHSKSKDESPFRLNLEQQKKRAKELLKAIRSLDISTAEYLENSVESSALLRFKQHHPQFFNKDQTSLKDIKLSDAQLVIARELGLSSWTKLKSHILAMSQSREAINSNTSSPDAEYTTLHIRCGSDLKSSLPAAGFIGDFLEYSDPYGQGPIIQDEYFIPTRAKFLYESYRSFMDLNEAEIQTDLEKSEDKLVHAAQQYERVVLWFEHDGYDQLILAKLMAYFANQKRPRLFEIVSINHFPGSARFIGLGQLPPEAIRLIWQQRKPINQKQLIHGEQVWKAIGQATPLPLYELMRSCKSNYLVYVLPAIQRHLQELPSTFNGLSLTEQLSLEMLNEKSMTAGAMFSQLTKQKDPLPWLGDVMYWFVLSSMAQASKAVFEINESDLKKSWSERRLIITQIGKDLLSGKQNWLALEPPARWLGGISIKSSEPTWCWDSQTSKPVYKK